MIRNRACSTAQPRGSAARRTITHIGSHAILLSASGTGSTPVDEGPSLAAPTPPPGPPSHKNKRPAPDRIPPDARRARENTHRGDVSRPPAAHQGVKTRPPPRPPRR